MKKRIIAIMCTAVVAFSLTACGGSKDKAAAESKSTAVTEAASAASTAASTDEEAAFDLASVDISNPTVVVELNDAEGMDALTGDMINVRAEEGTVVKVTGAASTTNSTCLMAEREDGSKIGVQLTVEGDWEAPQDGTILEAVGAMVMGKYAMEFHVLPENITVVSE